MGLINTKLFLTFKVSQYTDRGNLFQLNYLSNMGQFDQMIFSFIDQ